MKINFIAFGSLDNKNKKFFGGVELAPKRMALTLRKLGNEVSYNSKEDPAMFDVVNLHIPSYFTLKKLQKSVPVVVHAHTVPHDMEGGVFGFRFIKPFARFYFRKYYSKAKIIVAVSEYAKACIREIGVTTETYAIGNGVPLDNFPERTAESIQHAKYNLHQEYGFDPNKKIIGGIGSLFPRKGIKEFKQIAEALPDYQFIWVGKPQIIYPWFIFKRQLGKLPKNMQLVGYIPKLNDFYHGIDVLLVPTHVETQGIPPIEAAASKCPIIVRDIPVFDWIHHNRNAYRAKSVDEFVHYIEATFTDEEKTQQLIEQASQDVQQHAIEKEAHRLLEVYKTAIENGS